MGARRLALCESDRLRVALYSGSHPTAVSAGRSGGYRIRTRDVKLSFWIGTCTCVYGGSELLDLTHGDEEDDGEGEGGEACWARLE